ncbi:MAG: hypothetical protein ACJAUP_001624 [Cellvibrionaceae bacterium]|jgi:hypothetical protein
MEYMSKIKNVLELSDIRFLSPDKLATYNQGWHADSDGLSLVMKLGFEKEGVLGTLYYVSDALKGSTTCKNNNLA